MHVKIKLWFNILINHAQKLLKFVSQKKSVPVILVFQSAQKILSVKVGKYATRTNVPIDAYWSTANQVSSAKKVNALKLFNRHVLRLLVHSTGRPALMANVSIGVSWWNAQVANMGSADTKQIKIKNAQQILSALKIGPVWMAAALTCAWRKNV